MYIYIYVYIHFFVLYLVQENFYNIQDFINGTLGFYSKTFSIVVILILKYNKVRARSFI